MAYKTMLRQLISKWGIMSIDMVTALDADMAVIREDGTKEYVDNVESDAVESAQIEAEIQNESDGSEKNAGISAADALFGR